MIPPPPGVNLALGKPADQSSVGGPSRGRAATEAAAGAVNGRITGAPQMHTETERCPWWSVDLQLHARIREIRIFDGAAPTDCIASGLRHFFVEVSADGGRWDMVHAKVDDTVVSGADGSPLIVVPDEHTPARFVRIASVDEGALHLDQVEVYGDPVGPAVVAAPPPVIHAGRAAPVVHVEPRGGFGNQMVQYMVAAALAARVPGCLLSNVDLPRWNVKHPPLEPGNGPVLRIRPLEMRLEVEKLAEQLGSGALARVEIDSVVRHIGNFPAREMAAGLFRVPPGHPDAFSGYGADHLVINLRGAEVYHAPHPDQTLIPAGFYEELIARTGLKPVFMGQVGDNRYVDDLRRRFSDAEFMPSRGPAGDFEIVRRSRNIVVSVSVFSWLAAWLSDAERVFLPMSGFLNPFQAPEVDLLPRNDGRYQFHLFPVNYAVPARDYAPAHRAVDGCWRMVTPAMIEELRARRPRFGDATAAVEAEFDEAYYLAQNVGVAGAVERGVFASGLDHYRRFGALERRNPFPFDRAWYSRAYSIAAIETGQGDHADLFQHYLAVGRDRGYLPVPPQPAPWEERAARPLERARAAEA